MWRKVVDSVVVDQLCTTGSGRPKLPSNVVVQKDLGFLNIWNMMSLTNLNGENRFM